jgi:hypothetical protein
MPLIFKDEDAALDYLQRKTPEKEPNKFDNTPFKEQLFELPSKELQAGHHEY